MKKRISRIFCGILAILLLIQPLTALSGQPGMVVQAAESQSIGFEQSYGEEGAKLTVTIAGEEDNPWFLYQWFVDGEIKDVTGKEYPLTAEDLQKTICVDVYQADGTLLGSKEFFYSRLPVIYINTENNAEITSKETYLNADMKIQGNETYGEDAGLYDGLIEIRGRGNATWGNPKKPYKLKLDSSADLFGMGKSKHWVLLANYTDHSLIRNKISYDLSGAMGMPYMQSVYVDLILNGKYIGNYQLCEQVKLEEDRVNIVGVEEKVKAAAKAISKKTGVDKDDLEDTMMEDLAWITSDTVEFEGNSYKVSEYYDSIDITGGFLLELDYYDDEVSQIITNGGKRVKFKDPEYAVTNEELYNYVKDYVNTFEAAIESDDFHTGYEGESVHYSDLFDMESLVKFWMIQEIFFNWDGMNNSNYFYKDVDGKMKFGPIWDMDLTAGNGGATSTTTWQTFGYDFWQHPNQWYRYIVKDPYFIVQAYTYYHSIRDTLLEDMLEQITVLGAEMEESGIANKEMWHGSSSYSSSVNSFKTWMESHLQWMDEQFASPETMIASMGRHAEYTYAPSESILLAVDESKDQVEVNVTASDMDSITYSINGQTGGSAELSDGAAVITVANELLNNDGTPNTIQVFNKENKSISNFAVFQKQREPEVLAGTVTITGTAKAFATLSVDTSGLNDEAASIQWMADGVPVNGAAERYFRLGADLVGKQISVSVTGENLEGTVVSEKTAAVTAAQVQNGHLIINQVYGGGGAGGVCISNGYIELYNPTKETIRLDGYEIGYLSNRSSEKAGSTGGEVRKLALQGDLPSKASYLIRCAAENTYGSNVVLQLTSFDQEWAQTIDNKQYQVLLYAGGVLVDAVSVNEDALEGEALSDPPGDEIISKNKCVRRIGYSDTDQNTADFEVLNLTKIPETILNAVKPLTLADYVPPKDEVIAVKASLNVSKLSLQKGQTAKVLQLKKSSAAGDKIISWKSSDPKVVSINKKTGKMKGKKIGSAVITATLKSGGTATCRIQVIKEKVATKSFSLTAAKATLKVGKSLQIKIKVRKPLTANDKITYTSSNPKVLRVSKKGKVKALAKGSGVIKVRSASGKTKKIKITVK